MSLHGFLTEILQPVFLSLCISLIFNVLQKAVFWRVKGGISGADMPPFGRQYAAFGKIEKLKS